MKTHDKIKEVLNKNNVYYSFGSLRRKQLIESLAKEIEQIYTELTPNKEQESNAEELEDMFLSFIRTHHLRKKWEEFLDQYAKTPKTK